LEVFSGLTLPTKGIIGLSVTLYWFLSKVIISPQSGT
jgi:hypothetical protein